MSTPKQKIQQQLAFAARHARNNFTGIAADKRSQLLKDIIAEYPGIDGRALTRLMLAYIAESDAICKHKAKQQELIARMSIMIANAGGTQCKGNAKADTSRKSKKAPSYE